MTWGGKPAPDRCSCPHPSGSVTGPVGYVESADACGDLDNAWYYDDPSAPNQVFVCPATCERIHSSPLPTLAIEFGCKALDVSQII